MEGKEEICGGRFIELTTYTVMGCVLWFDVMFN